MIQSSHWCRGRHWASGAARRLQIDGGNVAELSCFLIRGVYFVAVVVSRHPRLAVVWRKRLEILHCIRHLRFAVDYGKRLGARARWSYLGLEMSYNGFTSLLRRWLQGQLVSLTHKSPSLFFCVFSLYCKARCHGQFICMFTRKYWWTFGSIFC
jgi:hypothetical protein